MTTATEIAPDAPDAEYRAVEALSATSVKWLLRSPAHYRHAMDNRTERTAFDVGHAVHAKVLGVGADIAVLNFPDRRTKAYKEAEQEARDNGQTPILAKDYVRIEAMAEAVLAHPVASTLLSIPGAPEVALSGIDPTWDIPIKCRIDWLPDRNGKKRTIPVDLKTTDNASFADFPRNMAKYGYHLQGAMVRHLISLTRGDTTGPFTLIAVESDPPHAVAVHDIAGEWAELADRRLQRAMAIYAECIKSGEWPAYPPVVHHPIVPTWLVIEEEREDMQ